MTISQHYTNRKGKQNDVWMTLWIPSQTMFCSAYSRANIMRFCTAVLLVAESRKSIIKKVFIDLFFLIFEVKLTCLRKLSLFQHCWELSVVGIHPSSRRHSNVVHVLFWMQLSPLVLTMNSFGDRPVRICHSSASVAFLLFLTEFGKQLCVVSIWSNSSHEVEALSND